MGIDIDYLWVAFSILSLISLFIWTGAERNSSKGAFSFLVPIFLLLWILIGYSFGNEKEEEKLYLVYEAMMEDDSIQYIVKDQKILLLPDLGFKIVKDSEGVVKEKIVRKSGLGIDFGETITYR